jgi:hypothetical protein
VTCCNIRQQTRKTQRSQGRNQRMGRHCSYSGGTQGLCAEVSRSCPSSVIGNPPRRTPGQLGLTYKPQLAGADLCAGNVLANHSLIRPWAA